jgi:hypothetical protein
VCARWGGGGGRVGGTRPFGRSYRSFTCLDMECMDTIIEIRANENAQDTLVKTLQSKQKVFGLGL